MNPGRHIEAAGTLPGRNLLPDIPVDPISTATADHYLWGDACDGWHLLRSPTLSVIQERMPPGAAETRHSHVHAQQLFFVLAGTLTIEIGGRSFLLSPRQAIHVAPGVTHQVRNEAEVAAEFLVVSEPPSHGDRTEAVEPPPGASY